MAALKAIDDLGHSGSAYDAAKQQLERKHGDIKKKVRKIMENTERFPAIRVRNAKCLDKFAEL